MKKAAYVFGYLGFFSTFVLGSFELIMISVNSFTVITQAELYLFFLINIFSLILLILTYLNDNYKSTNYSFDLHAFNLQDRKVAIIFLIMNIALVFLLLDSNCYNSDKDLFILRLQDFLNTPSVYLPIIPSIISGILFVINSTKNKSHVLRKKMRVS